MLPAMSLVHEAIVPVGITASIVGIRRALASAMPPAASPDVRSDTQLLATELATNVIRHSGAGPDSTFHIRLYTGDEGLRVEVEDPGAGFDRPAELPPPSEISGYGLRLVDRMADDWGVRAGPRPPTIVWFELLLQR